MDPQKAAEVQVRLNLAVSHPAASLAELDALLKWVMSPVQNSSILPIKSFTEVRQ